MRRSGSVLSAVLVLSLCAAVSALALEKEPVSGGLLSVPPAEVPAPKKTTVREDPVPAPTPVPAPAPAPAPELVTAPAVVSAATRKGDDTSWGLLVRGGYFGLPNTIADELFHQHPEVSGFSYGAEIRYHGEGGGRGGASLGLAVESASVKADGIWQQDESDSPETASGEMSMLAITLTGYWSLFPSWYVHPYFGIGIGAAHVKGFYKDETERVDADIWIPVVHIPIGLAVELGKRLQLAIEGRFIDGIAIGGALQVRF